MRRSVHLWIRKDGMVLQYATVDANSHILTIPLCRTLNSECINQRMLNWNCRRWQLANLKITHHVRKQTHASIIYLLVTASVHDLISSKFHQISPQRKEKITRSFSNRVTNTDRRKNKSISREAWTNLYKNQKKKNVHTHAHISQF